MAIPVQVTFDCADPSRVAEFWGDLLGYIAPPPPEGDSWEEFLEKAGVPREEWNRADAREDPEGKGPRLFFQRVPEDKTVKNRVHLDVTVAPGLKGDERRRKLDSEAERAISLGAREIARREDLGSDWIVMQDPEGNEFCLQ
ncbi:MAG TPA: VOC family protein [Actinomycetota bacterium]|nr:VOC family protein [Actinomycetota bacterium]